MFFGEGGGVDCLGAVVFLFEGGGVLWGGRGRDCLGPGVGLGGGGGGREPEPSLGLAKLSAEDRFRCGMALSYLQSPS